VLLVARQMLAQIPDGARELTLDDALGPGDKRELRQLRNGFVISYVDKFATKFLFTCKRMYALRMLREFAPHLLDRYNLSVMLCCLSKQQTGWRVALGERSGGPRVLSFLGAPTQTGTYTMPCQPDGTSPETCERVIERHLLWLRGEGISYTDFMTRQKLHSDRGPPPPTLAYPMAAAKLHKVPMGWRYIACSSTYTLRALSVWLTNAFRALMPAVHDTWNARMAEAWV
jgi:hypothetical protein